MYSPGPGSRAPDNPPSVGANANPPPLALLPHELRTFLALPGTNVLLVRGPAGSGKSTLCADLLLQLGGTRVLVAPRGDTLDTRLPAGIASGSAGPIHFVPLESRHSSDGSALSEGHVLAAGPFGADRSETPGRPRWVEQVLDLIPSNEPSFVVVDHWTPRSPPSDDSKLGPSSPGLEAEKEVQGLRTALRGSDTHLILVIESGKIDPPLSSMDGAIETGFETVSKAQVRTLTLRKLRGVGIGAKQVPYTLADGRFRCIEPVAAGFQPPLGPPDLAPSERSGYIWPGSEAFASVFGWLQYGALTSLELGEGVPDYVPLQATFPLVAHTLLTGGRVVWVPLPTSLPEVLVTSLSRWTAPEVLSSGLRILSAGGDEDHPLLGRMLLPLTRAAARVDPSPGTAARVAPFFAEGLKFLQGTPAGKPALYVLSLDGLRAVAAVTGVHYDPATFPLIVARYAQIPGFHGFAVRPSNDPLAAPLQGGAQTLIRAEAKLGRVFLTGTRPETVPHALSWEGEDYRFSLLPMR
jgi:hypothetical protein